MRRVFSVFAKRAPVSDFFRQSAGASIWNFGGMAFTLLNGVLTSRLLVPDDRGALALILTVSALSFLVASLGTNTAVRVFQTRELWASFRTYFSLTVRLIILNVALVVLAAFVFVRTGIVNFSAVLPAMVLLGVTTFVSSQLLDVLNAQGLISRSAAVNNLGHFSTFVALGIVFFVFEDGILSLILIAYIAGYVVRSALSVRAIRINRIQFGDLSPDRGRELVKQGVRFWGINLAQTLTSKADQILLAALSTTYAVGIYAVAVAPASVMQVVSNSIGQVALREAANGSLTARRLFRVSAVAFTVIGLYSVIMWVASPALIPFIYGSDYGDSVSVVRILLLAELARSPYLVLIRALAGFNRPISASASAVVGFPVLVVCMTMFVPRYGVEGAAYSVVIMSVTLLVASVASVIVAFRKAGTEDSSYA